MYDKEIEILENAIKSISDFDKEKGIVRIHRDNMFNKGYSLILTSFEEIKTLSKRLDLNIQGSIIQERFIQNMPAWKNHNGGPYPEKVQIELRKAGQLTREIQVDFKALYLFSVILLDQYVKFLHFINPINGIKSGTVERFINSLDLDEFYQGLKNRLGGNNKEILEKLSFYRDKKIAHRLITNEDTWFINDMRGGIEISHLNRDSKENVRTINPKELLVLVGIFFEKTSKYFLENESKIK